MLQIVCTCMPMLLSTTQEKPAITSASTALGLGVQGYLNVMAIQIVQSDLKLLTATEPSPLVPWISTFSRK